MSCKEKSLVYVMKQVKLDKMELAVMNSLHMSYLLSSLDLLLCCGITCTYEKCLRVEVLFARIYTRKLYNSSPRVTKLPKMK
jgi:hypothetical protein